MKNETMNKTFGIDEDRLKHMLGVAHKCYNLGKQVGFSESQCRTAFAMGFLHDIGYEFAEDIHDHPAIAADMAGSMGAMVIDAIAQHGDPEADMNGNIWLQILNAADMSIGRNGQETTVTGRIEDIGSRYGRDSREYFMAREMADKLESCGLTLSDRAKRGVLAWN